MMKILLFILIIAVAALFVIPEEKIGEYKGLLRLKYFLRDTAYKVKGIIFDLAKKGESEELKNIQDKAKESIETKIEEGADAGIKKALEGSGVE